MSAASSSVRPSDRWIASSPVGHGAPVPLIVAGTVIGRVRRLCTLPEPTDVDRTRRDRDAMADRPIRSTATACGSIHVVRMRLGSAASRTDAMGCDRAVRTCAEYERP